MHLLGPAWENLPLMPGAPSHTPSSNHSHHASTHIASHPLERSALTSAFRLMAGACARLRRASADALLAQCRRDGARGARDGGHGGSRGDLGTVLTRTLLPSMHAAVALVRGASMVVGELLQRQRHSSGDQVRALRQGRLLFAASDPLSACRGL